MYHIYLHAYTNGPGKKRSITINPPAQEKPTPDGGKFLQPPKGSEYKKLSPDPSAVLSNIESLRTHHLT